MSVHSHDILFFFAGPGADKLKKVSQVSQLRGRSLRRRVGPPTAWTAPPSMRMRMWPVRFHLRCATKISHGNITRLHQQDHHQ